MPFPIAPFRRFAQSNMTSTCIVIRVASIPNDTGGSFSSETEVAQTMCSLFPVTGRESVMVSQLQASVEGRALLPFGTEVHADDILRIEGIDYEVGAVLPRSSGLSAYVEVLVSRR